MKKALSLLLSATMVLGMTQQATMFAHAEDPDKGIVKGPGYEINFNEVKGSQDKDTFNLKGFHVDPNKRVDVIVKFESQSLVDKFLKSNQESFADYAEKHSSTVEKVENKVEALTDQVVEAADLKGTKNDAEVKDTYSVLFAGCSVEVPFKQIEKIQEMDGVEEVFLSHTYEVPQTDFKVENKPNMLTSHEMIGSENAWENGTGYDGTGTAIAVIDTGIDYYHEAFTTMPTNPKLSAADIQKVLDNNVMEAEKDATAYNMTLVANEKGGNNSVYKNAKIPYAFDYVDRDTDIVPVHKQYHGTHVAGTVAANCEKIKGVAPNAQLIGMKVFPDAGGAMDSDIMKALEDCVRLDLDSINMSLGSSSGFAKYGDSALQEAYEAIEKVGINLNISAGNSYNSAYGNNHNHLQPTSLPDEGIVGSPSTLTGALSVAAINNTHLGPSYFLVLKDGVVGFTDGSEANQKPFTGIGKGTYEVVDCGKGTTADFAKVNVRGKIAIIERGENTFQEKHDNAANAGAKAAIVYNHSSGSLTMSIDNYRIPCIFVTQKAGKQLIAEGKFSFDPSKKENVENPDAWTMCDFSSIGSTPSLEIKPEITAPGGNIHSAFYSDKQSNGTYDSVYGTISGTSMASPHVAGGTALVRSYVNEKFSGLDKIAATNMVNTLTMSTAKPVAQADGTFYLVRKQGAGIMQVDHAIETPAYLSVKGQTRPKAEVGYNEDGHYTYTVTVHNMSDKALTYDVKTTALAETSQEVDDVAYTTEVAENISKYCDITYQGAKNGKVTVAAGATADVTVDIQLDMNSDKVKEIQKNYVNGFFVEGFTQFTSDENVDLSVPFLGFCGDWGKAPVFDKTMYSGEKAELGEGSCLGLHISGSEVETAGVNTFKANHGLGTEYAEQCLSIKASDRLIPLTSLIRGAEQLNYKITDPKGKTVFEQNNNYIGKTYYTGSEETPFAYAEYWMKVTPLYEPGKGASEGVYTFTETAVVGGTNGKVTQDLTYHFTIDKSLPVWDKTRTV
ncbi:MAG: hypothetical protein E7277_05135, partial [Lachnospiraceae bacterium]|nr:hypothetical protein [Lachnospiraceae bacterium]